MNIRNQVKYQYENSLCLYVYTNVSLQKYMLSAAVKYHVLFQYAAVATMCCDEKHYETKSNFVPSRTLKEKLLLRIAYVVLCIYLYCLTQGHCCGK